MTWKEYDRRFPRDPWDAYPGRSPGAESWAAFSLRIGTARRDLAQRHPGETVVLACHGGVVEQSVVSLLGLAHHGELVTFEVASHETAPLGTRRRSGVKRRTVPPRPATPRRGGSRPR